MRLSYLFNSAVPSHNAGSIQVIKTCEGFIQNNKEVFIITPNTGLRTSIKSFYDLKSTPKRIKLKYFTQYPRGFKYYIFSILSVIKAISLKTDLFITRNLFTLIILNILKKKTIIEIHHDLSNEGRIVRFIYRNFKILNSRNILRVIAITKPVKKFLIQTLGVNENKIKIIPSASSLRLKFKPLKKKKKYRIGYFGSLEKSKGLEFIIKLAKIDKINDYFVYGGKKDDIDELNKTNNFKNLYLNKFVSYKNLKYHLDKMDVLIMPSNKKKLKSLGGVGNIAKYTSPLKLFDYLAAGKFIIISDLKVFNEIIRNNKHCIVMKLDHFKWLKVIQNIKNDLKNINVLKRNALLLSKQYTYKNRAKLILDGLN